MNFLAVFMSFLVSLTSLFSGLLSTGDPKAEKDDFVPVIRFVATSDTHIKTYGDTGCRRIAKLMQSAYQIAEADDDYKRVDAFLFNGDMTNQGKAYQYQAFTAYTKANLKGDTKCLGIVAKSHDSNTMKKEALEYFKKVSGQETTDYHEVINGFHFIGVSVSPSGEHYTDEQVQWLDAQLAAAVKDGGREKPVFVFQHEHVRNTVFGSSDIDGWGMTTFTEVLNKYPQVIHISGHSHYPANDPRSIWQGDFTAINDGGLAYYELTVDGENTVHPKDSDSMAQALFVEVDANNRVLVRVYDVTDHCFIKTYLIDNQNQPGKYSHTARAQAAEKDPPVFPENVQITVKKTLGGYRFTVPQAQAYGEDEIFVYRLLVTDKDNNVLIQDTKLSDYYRAYPADTVSFTVDKPGASGHYCAAIIAEDVWGVRSEPVFVNFDV